VKATCPDLGVPRQYDHPSVVSAMADVLAICKEHGVACGHPHVRQRQRRETGRQGFRWLMPGPVVSHPCAGDRRKVTGRVHECARVMSRRAMPLHQSLQPEEGHRRNADRHQFRHGEGFGAYRIAEDETLLDIVSSANLACGFHAGDAVIMDRTVRRAKERGVAIGAHIGFPDLMGFGRRQLQVVIRQRWRSTAILPARRSRRHRAGSRREAHARELPRRTRNLVAVDEPIGGGHDPRGDGVRSHALHLGRAQRADLEGWRRLPGCGPFRASWPTGHMTLRACSFRANGQTQ